MLVEMLIEPCCVRSYEYSISVSNVVITLRVSTLGLLAFGRPANHYHWIAMKEKSGQKTAIIVGMPIESILFLALLRD